MAYMDFKPNDIHVQIIVGANEEYKPTNSVKKIVEKVQKLKNEREEYLKLLNMEADLIDKLVKDQNQKWKEEADARRLAAKKEEHREKQEMVRQERLDNPYESKLSDPENT